MEEHRLRGATDSRQHLPAPTQDPTASSLIVDGIRKVIELCVPVATALDLVGWRQHEQLLKAVRSIARKIDRIAAKKGANYKQRLQTEYARLLMSPKHTRLLSCPMILSLAGIALQISVNSFGAGQAPFGGGKHGFADRIRSGIGLQVAQLLHQSGRLAAA